MARIIGGIGTSHVPTIAMAYDKRKGSEPAWAPMFEGYRPAARWLAEQKPDAIVMFFNDHAPPHFHARYGEHRGRVSIETGKPLDGDLPARALRLIEEWCSLHRDELRANWEHAERLEPLTPIDPLP